MCIAAVIFKALPWGYLQSMDEDNPHGGGIAYEKNGTIRFIKGLSAKDIYDLQEGGVLTYPYLLHFRWATHGGVTEELTHPFVLGPRALLGETSGECDALVIHNGTWPSYEKHAIQFINEGNFEFPEELLSSVSDTAIAAWLALYDENVLDSVPWATAVARIRTTESGERTMDITTRGGWEEYEDNWYSNLNWLPSRKYSRYWYSNNDYSSLGNPYYKDEKVSGAGREDEIKHWELCIGSMGWKSYVGDPDEAQKAIRATDKMYVGRNNDICVREAFYEYWYPEKDAYKPDNVDYGAWYDRFQWTNNDTDLEDLKQKDAARNNKENGSFESQTDSICGACTYGPHDEAAVCESSVAKSSLVGTSGGYDARGSWDDYIRAKYGDEVASALRLEVSPGEGDFAVENEDESAYSPVQDPDWLISDNPSVVNAALARQINKEVT